VNPKRVRDRVSLALAHCIEEHRCDGREPLAHANALLEPHAHRLPKRRPVDLGLQCTHLFGCFVFVRDLELSVQDTAVVDESLRHAQFDDHSVRRLEAQLVAVGRAH
jgi:hypothetical protein